MQKADCAPRGGTVSSARPRVERTAAVEPEHLVSRARILAANCLDRADDFTNRERVARQITARAIQKYAAFRTTPRRQPAQFSRPPHEDAGSLPDDAAEFAEAVAACAARLAFLRAANFLGRIYTSLLPQALRTRRGIYYTPPALVERLIDMATDAGVDWRSCRVLDPACGGGAFLAPIALKIVESLPECEPGILLNNLSNRLCGFEIDPFAAWMSQAFLEIALEPVSAAAGRRLPQLVTVCDSLDQVNSAEKHDLVIGNPPYGRVTLAPEVRRRFRRSLYGHANMYGLFTDLALRLAASNGVVAYVTPTSFLAGEYFKALRALLAKEGPPVSIDFVAERSGVFEDVLQETALVAFRRGGHGRSVAVHHLKTAISGECTIEPAGVFALPPRPSAPWLLPRTPAEAPLIARLTRMKCRLKDWGYQISTGPLVWNRHKKQLRDRAGLHSHPLIWAEAVDTSGVFIHRAEKKNHKPFFERENGDDWLIVDQMCVLVQRTTAKEQHRRLIAAVLPDSFIRSHNGVVVENHLNMVRAANGAPRVSVAAVAAMLNSEIADRAFRCISGSVAVSAFELASFSIPTATQMKSVEALIACGATPLEIEGELRGLYVGKRA